MPFECNLNLVGRHPQLCDRCRHIGYINCHVDVFCIPSQGLFRDCRWVHPRNAPAVRFVHHHTDGVVRPFAQEHFQP